MDWKRGGAALLAGVLLVAGALVVIAVDDTEQAPPRAIRLALTADQVQGPCAVITPPQPDPCEAASGILAGPFLYDIVNAQLYKNWVAANPGEVQRLAAIMAAPVCSTPATPVDPTMRTYFGSALAMAFMAYACAYGSEPLVWPAPNPPLDPKRSDKTPPSAPSGLTVTP